MLLQLVVVVVVVTATAAAVVVEFLRRARGRPPATSADNPTAADTVVARVMIPVDRTTDTVVLVLAVRVDHEQLRAVAAHRHNYDTDDNGTRPHGDFRHFPHDTA